MRFRAHTDRHRLPPRLTHPAPVGSSALALVAVFACQACQKSEDNGGGTPPGLQEAAPASSGAAAPPPVSSEAPPGGVEATTSAPIPAPTAVTPMGSMAVSGASPSTPGVAGGPPPGGPPTGQSSGNPPPGGGAPSSGGSDADVPEPAPDAGPPPPADAGMAGEPTTAVPSAGCGKAGRPDGGEVREAGDHIYTFPVSYDGTTPLPVVFAFHAAGNPIDQLYNVTRGSQLAERFVMVFPKSVGNGWSMQADRSRFDGWVSDLTDNYCVDESRLYATGHSSGAQFIVQLLCDGETRLGAVAPVASSAYCQRWDQPVAALVIHGSRDTERAATSQDADGRKDLAPYVASNSCQMSSSPYSVMGCRSSGTDVSPGCTEFAGCAGTLVWCQHDDPSYAGTNHGWPCFANQAILDFFSRP